jgi:hypothetical protein
MPAEYGWPARLDHPGGGFSFDDGLGFVHVGHEPVAKPFFL